MLRLEALGALLLLLLLLEEEEEAPRRAPLASEQCCPGWAGSSLRQALSRPCSSLQLWRQLSAAWARLQLPLWLQLL